jgi:hypothetical protein
MVDVNIVKKRVKKKMNKIKGGLRQNVTEIANNASSTLKNEKIDIKEKWDEFTNNPDNQE